MANIRKDFEGVNRSNAVIEDRLGKLNRTVTRMINENPSKTILQRGSTVLGSKLKINEEASQSMFS